MSEGIRQMRTEIGGGSPPDGGSRVMKARIIGETDERVLVAGWIDKAWINANVTFLASLVQAAEPRQPAQG
jgi:hypothetical protein